MATSRGPYRRRQPAFEFMPEPKAMADTSLQVYREIAPSLPAREAAVLDALRQHQAPPTAYELFEWMSARRLAADLNSVRPRLTALLEKGLVAAGDKRPCGVTGHTVYTWRITT